MEDTLLSNYANKTHLQPPSNSRRRRSLASKGRKPSNAVPPASPEVISSLISSLSSIETPFHDHFEHVPPMTNNQPPSSPGSTQDRTRSFEPLLTPVTDGLGIDFGGFDNGNTTDYFAEEFAVSPATRTSRHQGIYGAPGSSSEDNSRLVSLKDATKDDDAISFGNVSVEPGPRMLPENGRTLSAPKQSVVRRLSHRSSKEKSKEPENERHHKHTGRSSFSSTESSGNKIVDGKGGPVRSLSPKPSLPANTILEEQAFETFEPLDMDFDGLGALDFGSPLGTSTPNHSGAEFSDTIEPRWVPKRDSSLRHSYGATGDRRRRTRRHSSHDLSRLNWDAKSDTDIPLDEEDGVARRIRELKEQKRIRDEGPVDPSDFHISKTRTRSDRPKPITESLSSGAINSLSFVLDESAPSPTIHQGKSRDDWKRSSSSPLGLAPPVNMKRSASKLKKSTRSLSPQPAKHQRSHSNPLPPTEERPSSKDSIDLDVDRYMEDPRLTQKVRDEQTGRVIAFAEVGDPNGYVVFCCVGMGLTRYLMAFYDELALTLKLRLITLDRPGVGESQPYPEGYSGTPLNWPDDIATVCAHLGINKFSLLAHSAGAIYALATALRMPQQIRGRIHLLAPWIPPSQMTNLGSKEDSHPAQNLPVSQRFLRAIPTTFLKAANSSFMSATSTSITTSIPKSPARRARRKDVAAATTFDPKNAPKPMPSTGNGPRDSLIYPDLRRDDQVSPLIHAPTSETDPEAQAAADAAARERQADYDLQLTHRIWDLATTNANPAVDLIICLERRQTIGFRYVDIARAVVIHHGAKDTRVPAENVKWLGKIMRRCEVRILEGEGHGLMASAKVMSDILMEIAGEWEDWTMVTKKKGDGR